MFKFVVIRPIGKGAYGSAVLCRAVKIDPSSSSSAAAGGATGADSLSVTAGSHTSSNQLQMLAPGAVICGVALPESPSAQPAEEYDSQENDSHPRPLPQPPPAGHGFCKQGGGVLTPSPAPVSSADTGDLVVVKLIHVPYSATTPSADDDAAFASVLREVRAFIACGSAPVAPQQPLLGIPHRAGSNSGRSAARVGTHPNVVAFRDSFVTADGGLAIVMEYCDGGDLSKLISERAAAKQAAKIAAAASAGGAAAAAARSGSGGVGEWHWSEGEIWAMTAQLLLGVAHIHSQHVIHRDLKTSNVFVHLPPPSAPTGPSQIPASLSGGSSGSAAGSAAGGAAGGRRRWSLPGPSPPTPPPPQGQGRAHGHGHGQGQGQGAGNGLSPLRPPVYPPQSAPAASGVATPDQAPAEAMRPATVSGGSDGLTPQHGHLPTPSTSAIAAALPSSGSGAGVGVAAPTPRSIALSRRLALDQATAAAAAAAARRATPSPAPAAAPEPAVPPTTPLLCIGDFGVARVLAATHSLAHTRIGTPYYLAPEVIRGRPYDSRADIWAIGVITYELCALRRPFRARNLPALAMKVVRGQYRPLPPHYSHRLTELVSVLLERVPAQRPDPLTLLREWPELRAPAMELLKDRPDIAAKVYPPVLALTPAAAMNGVGTVNRAGREFAHGKVTVQQQQQQQDPPPVVVVKARDGAKSNSNAGHAAPAVRNHHIQQQNLQQQQQQARNHSSVHAMAAVPAPAPAPCPPAPPPAAGRLQFSAPVVPPQAASPTITGISALKRAGTPKGGTPLSGAGSEHDHAQAQMWREQQERRRQMFWSDEAAAAAGTASPHTSQPSGAPAGQEGAREEQQRACPTAAQASHASEAPAGQGGARVEQQRAWPTAAQAWAEAIAPVLEQERYERREQERHEAETSITAAAVAAAASVGESAMLLAPPVLPSGSSGHGLLPSPPRPPAALRPGHYRGDSVVSTSSTATETAYGPYGSVLPHTASTISDVGMHHAAPPHPPTAAAAGASAGADWAGAGTGAGAGAGRRMLRPRIPLPEPPRDR